MGHQQNKRHPIFRALLIFVLVIVFVSYISTKGTEDITGVPRIGKTGIPWMAVWVSLFIIGVSIVLVAIDKAIDNKSVQSKVTAFTPKDTNMFYFYGFTWMFILVMVMWVTGELIHSDDKMYVSIPLMFVFSLSMMFILFAGQIKQNQKTKSYCTIEFGKGTKKEKECLSYHHIRIDNR